MADHTYEVFNHQLIICEITGFACVRVNLYSGILHSCSIATIACHAKRGKTLHVHIAQRDSARSLSNMPG